MPCVKNLDMMICTELELELELGRMYAKRPKRVPGYLTMKVQEV